MRSLLTLMAFSCVAFSQTTPATSSAKTGTHHTSPTKSAAKVDPSQTFPTEPGLYAAFNTTEGRIVCKLYEKEAPVTVRNFAALARGTKEFTDPKTGARVKRPYYNGITFHRVIPGFMIQGGDPTGTGAGNGGVPTIVDEFDPSLTFAAKGQLAMANTGEPHTGATQFFITDGTPTYLNNHHTIFGSVVSGQEVVTKISEVPRGENDKPNTPVVIKSLVIRRVGPPPTPAKPAAKPAAKAAAKT